MRRTKKADWDWIIDSVGKERVLEALELMELRRREREEKGDE